MLVVSKCPWHGVFKSRHFAIDPCGSTVNLGGGNIEPCPRCGAPSDVMEGTFKENADGVVTILSAPQWTRTALAELALTLSAGAQTLSRASSPQRLERVLNQILTKVTEQNELLGETLRVATSTAIAQPGVVRGRPAGWNKVKKFIAALGIAVTLLAEAPTAVQTGEQVVEQVSVIVRDAFDDLASAGAYRSTHPETPHGHTGPNTSGGSP